MKIKKFIIGVLIVVLVILLNIVNAMYLNPKQLVIREEVIKSNKISSSFNDYIIAYFADLNYKGQDDENKLELLVKKINDIHPDVVIFGGDLVYKDNVDTTNLLKQLSDIDAKNCKYAILGDEDGDLEIDLLEKADFEVLDNENVQLYSNDGSFVNLIGLSIDGNSSKGFEGIGNGYNLVLTHYPDNAINISSADYILASHALGGRCYIPLISSFNTIDGAHKYYRGKRNVNGATLDVTNGVGTKEKSNRFLADAEIVFYKLEAN